MGGGRACTNSLRSGGFERMCSAAQVMSILRRPLSSSVSFHAASMSAGDGITPVSARSSVMVSRTATLRCGIWSLVASVQIPKRMG